MGWNYVREETPRLEAGDYRVAIVSAEEKTSKSGNPMIVLGIQPNKSNITINHYIVQNQYANRNLTQLFDAFPDIGEGNMDILTWVGCVGAARLKKDENDYLRVAWFIEQDKADRLPPWEGKRPERQTVTDLSDFSLMDESEDPF